jgi:hypothetical protein
LGGALSPWLPPTADEIADAAVVGTLLRRCEVAGGKLIHAAMIGDTLAADAVTGTSGIAAVTVAGVLLLIYAIHALPLMLPETGLEPVRPLRVRGF